MLKQSALGLAVVAALGLSATAQAYVIDTFDDVQATLTVDSAGDSASSEVSGSMMTGWRDIWIGEETGGVPGSREGTVEVASSLLIGNNDSGVISNIVIDWDGGPASGDASGAPTGNSGAALFLPAPDNIGTATAVDLTDTGGAAGFAFDVDFADLGFDFVISGTDTDIDGFGTDGTFSFTGGPTPSIPSPTTFGPIPFAAFTFGGGCTAATCFDDVVNLRLTIMPTGPARDFEIDKFYTVPAPGILALMGLGLAGLGAVRRRKA